MHQLQWLAKLGQVDTGSKDGVTIRNNINSRSEGRDIQRGLQVIAENIMIHRCFRGILTMEHHSQL